MPQTVLADTVVRASDNATIQPGGPRAGTNGKIFLNAEGSSNNEFASFGVVDFQTQTGMTFRPGDSLSLTLTQSNAAFTHDGLVDFYLSTDTTTNIQPGTSPLSFDVSALPAGLGSQLKTTYLLGTGMFIEVDNGHRDTLSFTPTGPTLSYLMTEIETAGAMRLILAPGDATVSATYAGFSNTTASTPGPVLSLPGAPIPEPSTTVLEAVGLLLAFACAHLQLKTHLLSGRRSEKERCGSPLPMP